MILQIINQSKITRMLVFVMIACILSLTTSCNQSLEEVELQPLSGEEYFEGIFFALGPFADKLQYHKETIRQLEEMSDEFLAKERKNVAKLMAKINEVDSEYFINLKETIESQDYSNAKKVLAEGGAYIYEYIDIIYPGIDIEQIANQIEADINSGEVLTDGEIDFEKVTAKSEEYERLLSNNFITSDGENNHEQVGSRFFLGIVCVIAAGVIIVVGAAVAAGAAVVLAVAIRVKVTNGGSNNNPLTHGDPLEVEMFVQDILTY